jgi:hypothetical protein
MSRISCEVSRAARSHFIRPSETLVPFAREIYFRFRINDLQMLKENPLRTMGKCRASVGMENAFVR